MRARPALYSWWLVLGPASAAASAQERPVPAFGTRAEAVTVDVVVLDKNGQPVRGLTRLRRRAGALVTAIETFSGEHASEVGRKSIFVVTQGFIRDDSLKQTETAVDVSQRGNSALYFVDPRGLVAGAAVTSVTGASGSANPLGLAGGFSLFEDNVAEISQDIDMAGAEQMAEEAGGAVIRDTNDIPGRLRRGIDEASAYYLLGYQPTKALDGRWHKLQVKTGLKNVTVRARRGYYASSTPRGDEQQVGSETRVLPPSTDAATPEQPQEPGASPTAAPSPPALPPQDQKAVPTFAARAEAITVDVVVLDKHGHPVVDLAPNEFTLFEDGRAQTIVGFEQRALAPPGTNAVPIDDGTQAATNERSSAPSGRTLAFLIDDLGIEPLHMTDVAKALTRWLTEEADARDDVTLATTSGDTWWSDRVGDGRADFQAVLGRLKGRKKLASVQDAMGDWEAYNIDTLGSPIEPPVAPSGPPRGAGSCFSSSPTSSMLERVMDRWFRTGACICDPMAVGTSIRSCRSQALGRSREVYGAATQRGLALLGGVERFSLGLAGTRGRKSVIVLSEALLRDIERSAFERALDASRRGNTAVSFVDVRGLIALPFYGADQTAAPNPGDVGVMTMEATVLETGGGEYMAEATGGSMVRDTNDLADGVTRLADESSAYYLLGYQSLRPLDGRWHKLDVKVSRPGLKVRARRGYFATAAVPSAGGKPAKEKQAKAKKGKGPQLPVRAIDPALAVGGERDGIPLRIAPYVFETNGSGDARVLVAVEVGTAALAFSGSDKQRTAQLDITILGVSRDHPKTVPVDAHVELSVDAQAVGGWWTFTRELNLPPGIAQIRALVRDTASGRSGLVTQRLEIPRSDAAYMSTPMLSDRIQASHGPAAASRLVPAAHRSFQRKGYLYCAYEVYVSPGRELHRIPHVSGGYMLQDRDGQVIDLAPPTPIAMALGAQISRLIALPLERLNPGRYELTLQTQDNEIGLNLQARQVFWVEAAAAAQAQPN